MCWWVYFRSATHALCSLWCVSSGLSTHSACVSFSPIFRSLLFCYCFKRYTRTRNVGSCFACLNWLCLIESIDGQWSRLRWQAVKRRNILRWCHHFATSAHTRVNEKNEKKNKKWCRSGQMAFARYSRWSVCDRARSDSHARHVVVYSIKIRLERIFCSIWEWSRT